MVGRLPLGERVADAEEVHADWRVGIGARLDILSSCGGRGDKKQREENKRPGRLTAMHSSGCGSVNKISGSVSRVDQLLRGRW